MATLGIVIILLSAAIPVTMALSNNNPSEDAKNVNTDGPSWKWLVGVTMSIIGVGFGAWMTSVWTQLNAMGGDLNAMRNTLIQIQGNLDSDSKGVSEALTEIRKLSDSVAADHNVLMHDHDQLYYDDQWIQAQVYGNLAERRARAAAKGLPPPPPMTRR